MTTKIYIDQTFDHPVIFKGHYEERKHVPVFEFWNLMFPTIHLRHNPDINAIEIMIEVPLVSWKQVWQDYAMKLFNRRIGKYNIITRKNSYTAYMDDDF